MGWAARFWEAAPCLAAIVEDGFEEIVVGAARVRFLIQNQTSCRLSLAPWHRSGLAVVDLESFFQGDRRDLGPKADGIEGWSLLTREEQVVGIAGVVRANRSRQSREPTVEPEGCQVSQSGRGGCPLGEVEGLVELLFAARRDRLCVCAWL